MSKPPKLPATASYFKEIIDDYILKSKIAYDFYKKSQVLITCKPLRTEGYLTRFLPWHQFLLDDLEIFNRNMEISKKNQRNELVDLNLSPYIIWERVLTQLFQLFVIETPRLDGECTAVMRALNALREIMRIIELHNGVVGVNVFHYSEIEDDALMIWIEDQKKFEYHQKAQCRDITAITEKLLKYQKDDPEKRRILKERMEKLIRKYKDETFYYQIPITYQELVVRYEKKHKKTTKPPQHLIILPLPPRRASPAPPRVIPHVIMQPPRPRPPISTADLCTPAFQQLPPPREEAMEIDKSSESSEHSTIAGAGEAGSITVTASSSEKSPADSQGSASPDESTEEPSQDHTPQDLPMDQAPPQAEEDLLERSDADPGSRDESQNDVTASLDGSTEEASQDHTEFVADTPGAGDESTDDALNLPMDTDQAPPHAGEEDLLERSDADFFAPRVRDESQNDSQDSEDVTASLDGSTEEASQDHSGTRESSERSESSSESPNSSPQRENLDTAPPQEEELFDDALEDPEASPKSPETVDAAPIEEGSDAAPEAPEPSPLELLDPELREDEDPKNASEGNFQSDDSQIYSEERRQVGQEYQEEASEDKDDSMDSAEAGERSDDPQDLRESSSSSDESDESEGNSSPSEAPGSPRQQDPEPMEAFGEASEAPPPPPDQGSKDQEAILDQPVMEPEEAASNGSLEDPLDFADSDAARERSDDPQSVRESSASSDESDSSSEAPCSPIQQDSEPMEAFTEASEAPPPPNQGSEDPESILEQLAMEPEGDASNRLLEDPMDSTDLNAAGERSESSSSSDESDSSYEAPRQQDPEPMEAFIEASEAPSPLNQESEDPPAMHYELTGPNEDVEPAEDVSSGSHEDPTAARERLDDPQGLRESSPSSDESDSSSEAPGSPRQQDPEPIEAFTEASEAPPPPPNQGSEDPESILDQPAMEPEEAASNGSLEGPMDHTDPNAVQERSNDPQVHLDSFNESSDESNGEGSSSPSEASRSPMEAFNEASKASPPPNQGSEIQEAILDQSAAEPEEDASIGPIEDSLDSADLDAVQERSDDPQNLRESSASSDESDSSYEAPGSPRWQDPGPMKAFNEVSDAPSPPPNQGSEDHEAILDQPAMEPEEDASNGSLEDPGERSDDLQVHLDSFNESSDESNGEGSSSPSEASRSPRQQDPESMESFNEASEAPPDQRSEDQEAIPAEEPEEEQDPEEPVEINYDIPTPASYHSSTDSVDLESPIMGPAPPQFSAEQFLVDQHPANPSFFDASSDYRVAAGQEAQRPEQDSRFPETSSMPSGAGEQEDQASGSAPEPDDILQQALMDALGSPSPAEPHDILQQALMDAFGSPPRVEEDQQLLMDPLDRPFGEGAERRTEEADVTTPAAPAQESTESSAAQKREFLPEHDEDEAQDPKRPRLE